MKISVIAVIVALAVFSHAQQPVSRYAEDLRVQNEKTQAVSSELMEMIRQGEKDPDVISRVGRRFLTEYDGAISVLDRYRSATTRFGLQSEIDDLMQLNLALQAGQTAVHILVEGTPPPPFTEREISLARQTFKDDILPMIKEFVDQQLEVQGAADFLTDPGFEQAAVLVATHIGSELRGKVENEIRKVVGLRIHIGMSLKEHILTMARSWVSKSVGNIFLRFAANHFIVERLGVKILEWIGPRLREFLRPKGNLEARVNRAIAGVKERRMDLNRMDSDEDMMDVRRMVEAARSHLNANKYLRSDLNRARRDDLSQRLIEEEKKLLEAIDRARLRFFMNSKFAEVFGKATKEWRSGRKRTADLLEKLQKSPAIGIAAGDPASKPGAVWRQSETYRVAIGGTWTLDSTGKKLLAKWANGAEAILTLVTCNATTVVVTRDDQSGVSRGLKATYRGTRTGSRVTGKVDWTWPDGRKGSGTWSATLPSN